jgi:hypothetical protein
MSRYTDVDAQVVRASWKLPPSAKLVWLEDRRLNPRGDGCWLSHEQLGMRLGMSGRTVEAQRLRLQWVGLYDRVAPGPRRPAAWCALLPVEVRLRVQRPTVEAVTRAREVLDAMLPRKWPPDGPAPVRDSIPQSSGTEIATHPSLQRDGNGVPSTAFDSESLSEATSAAVEDVEAAEIRSRESESKAAEGGPIFAARRLESMHDNPPQWGTGNATHGASSSAENEDHVRAAGLAQIRARKAERDRQLAEAQRERLAAIRAQLGIAPIDPPVGG